MKKSFLFFIVSVVSLSVSAQEADQAKSFADDPFHHPLFPVYMVSFFVFVVIALVAIVALYMIRVLNVLTEIAEREKAARLGIAYVPKPTFWSRFAQQMNNSVPLEAEKTIELDHTYDGIKELDNHLPPWWKWLFYGTIGWSFLYIIVFHLTNSLPLSGDEYQNEVAAAQESTRILEASRPRVEIDEDALTFTNDAEIIAKGHEVFTDNNCGSCHGPEGGGNSIGPNLTDSYWLHGGSIKNVFSTIKNGVVEKGMPAWGKSLRPEEVRNVAFFIMSLQGSKPANPKGPQGDLYKPLPVAKDSTQASL